jgi:hypothetical protein
MERSGRPGGWIAALGGEGQAMDKQPDERQCDGQQHPAPQPGGENTHMLSVPSSPRLKGPLAAGPGAPVRCIQAVGQVSE